MTDKCGLGRSGHLPPPPKGMRILVTGSRDWENKAVIWQTLNERADKVGVTLVSGHCPTGADKLAEDWAHSQPDIVLELHPADWKKYGKRAGFVRNAEMVDLGADICLAFIKNHSKGASMTLRLALDAGIRCVVFRED